MKKIININLSGRLIPIEDSAYELLKNYLDSLKLHFSREEGGEEIVSDIEDRIAELFQDKLKKGAHCITDQDIGVMVATMGRPEQLEEETSTEPQQKVPAGEAPHEKEQTEQPKRLLRNVNDKLIGGVCSGIANYFKTDPALIRVLTFLLILVYGFGLLIYIILWIVLPSSSQPQTKLRRRLYRNTDSKVLGGVASGIGAYLKIDPVIPRLIFVLPLLGVIFTSIFFNNSGFLSHGMHNLFFPFSIGALPTLILLYIVLWIAVPQAVTPAEKLEMKGEKVDVQSLSNAYKSTGDEKKKMSQEAPEATTGTEQQVPYESSYDASKRHSGFGEIFGTLVKIVLYFILGVIVLGICGVLIAIAGGFLGVAALSSTILPFKALILASPMQHFLVWPALFLTLGIPVIAIIWLLVRLITGYRSKMRYIGLGMFLLWVVGVVCTICLIISIGRDFQMRYSRSEAVNMTQPTGNKLILKRQSTNIMISGWNGWFGDFIRVGADTVRLEAVHLSVLKSEDSSYHAKIIFYSDGRSAHQAASYVSRIKYKVVQKDSILYISDGFALLLGTPFRNQHVELKIFVPEGKNLDIRDHLEQLRSRRFHWKFNDDWDGDWDDDWQDHQQQVQVKAYQMTPAGLKIREDTPFQQQY